MTGFDSGVARMWSQTGGASDVCTVSWTDASREETGSSSKYLNLSGPEGKKKQPSVKEDDSGFFLLPFKMG